MRAGRTLQVGVMAGRTPQDRLRVGRTPQDGVRARRIPRDRVRAGRGDRSSPPAGPKPLEDEGTWASHRDRAPMSPTPADRRCSGGASIFSLLCLRPNGF